jgi:hypothetical protein
LAAFASVAAGAEVAGAAAGAGAAAFLATTFFTVFGAASVLMFTIEADCFADISNAVMYILLPDGVNR